MTFLTRCLLLALGLPAASALASFDDDPATVRVVQVRQFRMAKELGFSAGMLPLDSFYKGLTGQVTYTHHFSDHFAWQVGRATVSLNLSTGLAQKLERDFGILTTEYPRVSWMVGSDLVWKPLYGKLAFMNAAVLHVELYALGGGTVVGTQLGVGVGPTVGGGLRFYGTNSYSLKVEVANHFVLTGRRYNVLSLQGGVSFNFGGE